MPKTRPPYPAEFRDQMVELVQAGRTPAELSREFGVTAQSIAAWVAQAAANSGKPVRGKVNANQANVPVHRMCRVLRVSPSGYYAWRDRAPPRRSPDDAVIVERIRAIHAESDATYGMPRVRAELHDQGVKISTKRVARLMRCHAIRGVSRRRGFTVTTREMCEAW